LNKSPANSHERDLEGNTPLHVLLSITKPAMIMELLKVLLDRMPFEVDRLNINRESPLSYAIKRERIQETKLLLQHNPSVHVCVELLQQTQNLQLRAILTEYIQVSLFNQY
jgi:ankyrin repeat protein